MNQALHAFGKAPQTANLLRHWYALLDHIPIGIHICDRDSIEAAIHIYRQFGVRSIFATAHSDPRTRERGMAANPLAWMPKPYSPVALIETIKTLLGASPD